MEKLLEWRKNNPDKLKKARKKWIENNPDKKEKYALKAKEYRARKKNELGESWLQEVAEKKRKDRRKIKLEIISAYGGKCSCCGESNPFFLQIDHKNDNGYLERNGRGNNKVTGYQFYLSLRRLNFPSEDYQLLCANCNIGKELNGGICPHVKTLEGFDLKIASRLRKLKIEN